MSSRSVDPKLAGAIRALNCDRVTAEVVTAMNVRGVASILLKGPSIARWLYPGGGRTYGDTDLLVRTTDFNRAEDVLRGLGFTEKLAGFNPFEIGDAAQAENPYIRRLSARGAPAGEVDLHRNLSVLPAPDDAVWEILSVGTETVLVGGVEVKVLGRIGLALHVVLHAVQHGFKFHTDEDLRRAVVAMSPDDWRPVAELARRLGVEDVLGSGLRRHPASASTADLLGLPSVVADDPRFWMLSAPRGAVSLREFWSSPNLETKLRWLRWTIFPSPARMRLLSGLQPDSGSARLLAAYVRRCLGLVPAAWRAGRLASHRPRA
jgi:hypothetical protein